MLYTAFTMGLLGSLHCVGMCGPLMLALPFGQEQGGVWRLMLYNVGRITTYSLLGAMMGLLGQGVFLVGMQSWLTLLLGGLLIGMGLFSLQVEFNIWNTPLLSGWYLRFKSAFARLVKRTGLPAVLGLGLLNGLLPCGLVYLALAAALTTTTWLNGAGYMLFFGLGTWPLLLVFTALGHSAGHRFQKYLRKAYPLILTAMGVFLVWRALQFQMPTSFNLWETLNNAPMCH
ncbi:MAG: sulfite exporter TauE/SafE family protein [Saprospiraceae bacterium]